MASVLTKDPSSPGAKTRFTDFDELLRLGRVMHATDRTLSLASWPKYAAQLAGSIRWTNFFDAVTNIGKGSSQLFHLLLDGWPAFFSAFARRTAMDRHSFRFGDAEWTFGRLGQTPVVWSTDFAGDWVWAPVAEDNLIAGVVDGPMLITFDAETGCVDLVREQEPLPEYLAPATVAAIEATEKTPGPRSWTLYGPPGGGKTTAARQIADLVGNGSRLTIAAGAVTASSAWEVVHAVKPRAIVIDDIDSDNGATLLQDLVRARAYADVIVMTANTLDLRGALLRPGRTDEAPVLFDKVDMQTARAIAPTVPETTLAAALESGLLCAYLAELELRHLAGRDMDAAVEELAERVERAGDR